MNAINTKISLIFLALVMSISNFNAQIVINEIMVNPAGANDGSNMPNTSEWVELFNPTSSAINLSCWYFTDGDFAVTFPTGSSIPAYGYFTIASSTGSGLSPNLDWATCGCTSNNPGANGSLSGNQVGIFTNGNEQVLLYDNSNTIQDAIIWGGGQLTSALTLTITATGSCGAKTITIPSTTASYENIGTHTDGVAKERQDDASATWQNTSSPTFGTANSAIILENDFLDFNATMLDESVELSWISIDGVSSDTYYIEKSVNGVDFYLLDVLIEKSENSFRAKDFKSEEIVYYRIKKVDVNNYSMYSDVRAVTPNNTNDVRVFPNPSTNGTINLVLSEENQSEIIINDMNGNLIYRCVGVVGLNKLEVGQIKGIYIVSIVTANSVERYKFIMQ